MIRRTTLHLLAFTSLLVTNGCRTHLLDEGEGEAGDLAGKVLDFAGTVSSDGGGSSSGWRRVDTNTSADLHGLWGSGPNDVFAVGNGGFILRGGSAGAFQRATSMTTANLRGVWGSDANTVYAVGDNGTIVRGNGMSFTLEQSGSMSPLVGIWGTGPRDVFVLEDRGNASGVLFKGMSGGWQRLPPPSAGGLHGIWGTGPFSIFLVGNAGQLLRPGSGLPWVKVATGTLSDLFGINGENGELYAVGSEGTILRSTNASAWTLQTSNTSAPLFAVWRAQVNEAYAVGGANNKAVALHTTDGGKTWLAESVPALALFAVWGSSPNDVWVAGAEGAIFHREP